MEYERLLEFDSGIIVIALLCSIREDKAFFEMVGVVPTLAGEKLTIFYEQRRYLHILTPILMFMLYSILIK